MFGLSEKIFNVYEKPEAAEPTERVELVREGFSFFAFALNFFWLIFNRLWWVLLGYVVVLVGVMGAAEMLHVSETSRMLAQVAMNLLLGFHAYDLQGWVLKRRGYRLGGVLVGESELAVQRRYYEFAS
jgi:Protein of unknown function (DUF2628)